VKQNVNTADRQITRAAGVVMVGMALSSVTGLVTTMMVSHAFGTSAELDAFYAANRLTEILFNLMAGGALASAFIPTFTDFLTRKDHMGAWRLASSIANLLFILLSFVAVLASFAAPWLVRNVLAPGFEDQALINLTVLLLRVMLISSVVFGISGLLMGILNAHHSFALPALAPAFYRIGWMLGIWFLVPRMGIHGLAWGVVLGSLLHLLIQIPGLRNLKMQYDPILNIKDPSVRQVGRLMGPRLVGVAVVQINFLVNTIIASTQPEGSLSAINLAFTLMIMPQAVIAQATGIAALPTFSQQVSRGNLNEMRTSLANTLRSVLFLSLPASLGLILLRKPLVSLLLQRGAFDIDSTEKVSWALLWYAAGLVGHSLLEIVVRAFYAMKDTRTPVIVGAIAMSLNVIYSLLFTSLFQNIGWAPHGGLALANSLATALECLTLLYLIRLRLKGLDLRSHLRGILATFGAAAVMSIVLYFWLEQTMANSTLLSAGGGVVLGGAIYWGASLILGAPDARQYPESLLRRLNE
jgi:putative peptidoglycan lipid II flippase